MLRSREQERRETLAFWLIVLLVCAVAGAISYQAGRSWVGSRLAEVDVRESRPAALSSPGASGTQAATEKEVPLQPVVEVEERAATEGEQLEMELRQAEAQAGSGTEADEESGAGAGRDGQPAERAAQESDEWVVAAGSFAQAENARSQAEKLKAKGFRPVISDISVGGVSFRRVSVARFASRTEADKLVAKLRQDGFAATVIRAE